MKIVLFINMWKQIKYTFLEHKIQFIYWHLFTSVNDKHDKDSKQQIFVYAIAIAIEIAIENILKYNAV